MRTTLDLDEAVLDAARSIAREEGVSLGRAVSQLALRGLTGVGPIDITTGFPTFTVEVGSRPITLESVNEHRD